MESLPPEPPTTKKPKPPGGRFSTFSYNQLQRVGALRRKARTNPELYGFVLAPDPEKAVDAVGGTYYGSNRHLWESALQLLEAAFATMERKRRT